MNPCLNMVTIKQVPFPDDVQYAAEAGFTCVELWYDKLADYLRGHSLDQARQALERAGVEAPALCFQPNLCLKSHEADETLRNEFLARLEVCQALGCRVLIAPAGKGPRPSAGERMEPYRQAAENLRSAAELAQQFGVTLALEFIAGSPFIDSLASAALVVREADHPALGILFDTYHFWAGRSKLADFAHVSAGKIAFVHVNDVPDMPREILTDPDRVRLGEGVIPLAQLLEELRAAGYDGPLSLELFRKTYWESDPRQVCRLCFASFSTVPEL